MPNKFYSIQILYIDCLQTIDLMCLSILDLKIFAVSAANVAISSVSIRLILIPHKVTTYKFFQYPCLLVSALLPSYGYFICSYIFPPPSFDLLFYIFGSSPPPLVFYFQFQSCQASNSQHPEAWTYGVSILFKFNTLRAVDK